MPFPPDVKQQVLVWAARRCCVCHEPKGARMEIHHIEPEADGGPNTLENAIPLCYDCHHDAGHYNNRQPRGNKFGPEELRKHRDTWYEIVRTNKIPIPDDSNIACQYLIISDLGVTADLLTHNSHALPFDTQTLFATNPLLEQFAKDEVIRLQRGFNSGAVHERFDCPPTLDEYLAAHSDAEIVDGDYGSEARRPFSLEHLRQVGAPQTAFIESFIDVATNLDEICWISAEEGGCGSDDVSEEWHLPQFVSVWALLTNVSQSSLTLQSLNGIQELPDGYGARPVRPKVGEPKSEIGFPPVPLLPNQAVLVPIASAYAVDGVPSSHGPPLISESIGPGSYQEYSAVDSGPILMRSRLVGPAFWPASINYLQNGRAGDGPIHPLNPGDTYSIRRGVEYGSCPHLFFRYRGSTKWVYHQPLLAGAEGHPSQERVQIPPDATEVCIAELEAERTVLRTLQLDHMELTDIVLDPGAAVSLLVKESQTLYVEGQYRTLSFASNTGRANGRKLGVRHFIRDPDSFIRPTQSKANSLSSTAAVALV